MTDGGSAAAGGLDRLVGLEPGLFEFGDARIELGLTARHRGNLGRAWTRVKRGIREFGAQACALGLQRREVGLDAPGLVAQRRKPCALVGAVAPPLATGVGPRGGRS